MTDRDERIRELAYFLWLEEGCPEDAAERHGLAAERSSSPPNASGSKASLLASPQTIPAVIDTAGSGRPQTDLEKRLFGDPHF